MNVQKLAKYIRDKCRPRCESIVMTLTIFREYPRSRKDLADEKRHSRRFPRVRCRFLVAVSVWGIFVSIPGLRLSRDRLGEGTRFVYVSRANGRMVINPMSPTESISDRVQ